MSNNEKNKDQNPAESKEGIDIKKVTIDENGEVKGLDDNDLEDASGGLADTNVWCDSNC
jgi:hypothetical protein